jgi:hypothetical protein
VAHLAIGTFRFRLIVCGKRRDVAIFTRQFKQLPIRDGTNCVGMVVNFIHGHVSWVSFFKMALFRASVSCNGDHCIYSVCASDIRVSSVRATAKTSATLRSTLSNVRHNGLVSWHIVSTSSIVQIVSRCCSNFAGRSSGGIVIVTTIAPSTATTAAFTQLQNLLTHCSKLLPIVRGKISVGTGNTDVDGVCATLATTATTSPASLAKTAIALMCAATSAMLIIRSHSTYISSLSSHMAIRKVELR